MKHTFLSLMLASTFLCGGLMCANTAGAQDMPAQMPAAERQFDHEQMRQKMMGKIAKDLDLTDEQQQQAKQIREEGRKEIEPLMNEMKELRKKMDAKRRANMEEFEKILTPEQKAKFEEMKKNAPKPHFDKMHGKKGHPKHFMKHRTEGFDGAAPQPEAPQNEE
ncbi:MAG: Spy/CpxP family protein refolding chaperone [Alphaproteobacteria bacterium]|nr:Spy/CpxP family protein refolding chaperone [Alphaproteobacteria bacterium]